MGGMAAALSVLVQAKGIAKVNKDLQGVQSNLEAAGHDADYATRQVDQFGRSRGTAKLDVDAQAAHKQIAAVKRDIDSVSGKSVKVNVQQDTDKNAAKGMGDMIRQADLLGKAMALFRPAAMIAGFGMLIGLASSLAAGLVSVISALAPGLVGAMGAGAVAATAYAQALGVVKLGMLGAKAAFKPFVKDLKEPTPAMTEFARTVAGVVVPSIKRLRDTAQAGLLPGVAEGVQRASGVFKYLGPVVAATAKVMGGLATRAGELVGSSGFGQDLQAVGMRNAGILKILGGAALNVANALRHVLVVAGPLATWLATTVVGWAKMAAGAAQAGRATGTMSGFFEKARVVLGQLFSIVGSVATALFNVGKAAAPVGMQLLAALAGAAKGWAAWTGSLGGQNKMKKFFDDAKPVIVESAKLIRDVVKGLAGMASQPGLAKLVGQLRTGLLPVLVSVLKSTTATFGPALVGMIVAFARAFQPLAGAGGPLVLLAKALTLLANAATWITQHVPGGAAALTLLGGTLAILSAIGMAKFTSELLGTSKGFTALKTGAVAVTGAMNGWTVSVIRAQIAAGLAAILRGLVTAFWLLNAAMLANPFVLVVAAIAAVIAIFVLLGGKLTWIGAAFNWLWGAIKTVFSWIVANWPLLLAILTGPIGLAVLFIVNNWNTLKAAAVSVFNAIASVITTVWSTIVTVTVAVWSVILTVLGAVWNAIKTVVSTVAGTVMTVVSTAWHWISSVTSTVWATIAAIVSGAWGVIGSVVSTVVSAVRTGVTNAWNTIKSTTSAVWDAIKGAVSTAINGALTVVTSVARSIGTALGGAWNTIKTTAETGWNKVQSAITGPVSGAYNWIKNKISDFVGIGGDIVRGIADGIASAARTVLDKLTNLVNSAKRGVKKLLGIGSPSKVFAEYGHNIATGLAVGIDGSAVQAAQAAARMAAGTTAMMPPSVKVAMDANAGAAVAGGWTGRPPPPGSPGDGGVLIPAIHIYVGEREITDIVKVEIEQDGKRTAQEFLAGTMRP